MIEGRAREAEDADCLSEEQLDLFRGRLQAELAEIVGRNDGSSEDQEAPSGAADPLDRATLEELYATRAANRRRDQVRIAEILKALRRIDDGEYGYCAATGEPIGVARLLAYPTAELSVEAQQAAEIARKRYG